jgi:hypothetical protein
VIGPLVRAWERRLAAVDTNRVVLPFEWGVDWLGLTPSVDPRSQVLAWAGSAMADPSRLYRDDTGGLAPAAFALEGDALTFASALPSPFPINNTVRARVFPADPDRAGRARRAVVVLPQWNADAEGHVGLCRLFARFGLTAVRLSLPYHDERRLPDLARADYIVSANIGRTIHANRQAVLDARRVVDWLALQGYERIGIMGTSLGSCLAMLTMAHDNRIRAGAFNHVSPFFADVVWRGLSTRQVRAGLDGHISLDDLRACWLPISPRPFIERVRGRAALLVYARYDLSFPVDLSRQFLADFDRLGVPHDTAVLPCGHYTTAKAPFKYLDGYALTKFFVKRL